MALVISEIKLYELLKNKIGEREAEAFIEILEKKVESKLEEKTTVFATKEDLARTEGRLYTAISESKVDVIKWMVAASIMIVGIIVAFMKFNH